MSLKIKRLAPLLTIFIMVTFFTSCAVKKTKNIDYGSQIQGISESPTLHIYAPKKALKNPQPVLIFVYGGNWNSGKKEIYGSIGRNFAHHDMVAVLPDYTKSPKVSYDEMAREIATSIKWVKENISAYGGNPSQIYLTGHSAGGHLVALATMNPSYGIDQKDIKGIILNDSAGLDMESYLKKNPPTTSQDYLSTWTDDPENWKQASPINFITAQTPKMKIYTGEKSYESITSSNKAFIKELNKFQPDVKIQWLDKKHAAMVTQLFWPWNDRYEEISQFMHQ
ncbi:alpha/beta hydrolase [Nonlabens antarcticus]|uniref:alpha/beta hydrolase n=1 Tax=Nonlabens antarcticus TaxID=392714 RepID=UPI001E416FAE|nr:alpha/beta hydrolase [Nonlabens antarcticus]